MFNPTVVEETANNLKRDPRELYLCKLARWDAKIDKIYCRELNSGGGWIPESNNPNWDFPVVQFPNGRPDVDDNVTVLFAEEPRQEGLNSRRCVVRVYKQPQRNKPASYRISAVFFKYEADEIKLLETIENKTNMRFVRYGNATSWDDSYKPDRVAIVICKNDSPVLFGAGGILKEA